MPSDQTYVYHPTFGGMTYEIEGELCTAFFFGISTGPTVIPDLNSSKGSFYRKLVPLTADEAATRLIERLAEKALDMASAAPIMRASLIRGLEHVRRDAICSLPGVRSAVLAAIAAAEDASAAPAVEEGLTGASAYALHPKVAALQATVAAQALLLAAVEGRLAALEAAAAPAAAIVAYPQPHLPHLPQLRLLAGIAGNAS